MSATILATFVWKFDTNNFQKLPNLVTLRGGMKAKIKFQTQDFFSGYPHLPISDRIY